MLFLLRALLFSNGARMCSILVLLATSIWAEEHARDNGDVYLVRLSRLSSLENDTAEQSGNGLDLDLDQVMEACNSSFTIPMDYLTEFNATAQLPDEVDKTGMCYIRCYYESAGLIDNWKLDADKVRRYLWLATGDSISVCEQEGKSESNACVRAYAIAQCLMKRAIVDARPQ